MPDQIEDEVRRLRKRVSELESVVSRDLGVSVGPSGLPTEPQSVECDNCDNEFEVTVKNGLVCPHCGKNQSDEPKMSTDGGPTDESAGSQHIVSQATEHGFGIRVKESPGGAFLQEVDDDGDVESSIFAGDDEALQLISVLAEVVGNE